jgi:alpha-tubulin suppressor-like RCC1 family protein
MASGFNINGSDIEGQYISKSYLLDRYPEIANQFKSALAFGTGRNDYGSLGNNGVGTAADFVAFASTPVQTVSGGSNWKNLYATGNMAAGIKTDGTLWLWGEGTYGQLGDNTSGTNRSSPVQIVTGGTWKTIAMSYNSFCVGGIKTDGTLWSWGYQGFGELGNNIENSRYSSPVQTISGGSNWEQVSMGSQYTVALKNDGTIWAWGNGANGRLGINSTASKSSPNQITAAGNGWTNIVAGTAHVLATKFDGTLYAWGLNNTGAIGDSTLTSRSTPAQITGTTWKQPAAGQGCSACIKTDGTLWVWGTNTSGRLGTNDTTNRSSPVQTVAAGTNWKFVNIFGDFCTGGIKTDGTLWLWGDNSYGKLADGTTTHRSSPIQMTSGGNNWKQVVCGSHHNHFIRDDSMELNFGAGTL